MTKLFISTLAISALLTSFAQAAEIKTDSTIKAVTVYPSSAKVVRISTIKLEAGDNDVVIKNLPINLNESSLRVSGEGQGTISLGSVELLRSFQEDVVQEREKIILENIEELQSGRRKIQDALQRSRNQFDYIKRMVFGSKSKIKDPSSHEGEPETYRNLPIEKWQSVWETLDAATATVQEKTRVAEKSLKDYDKQIKKLNNELRQVAVNQKETRTAKLHVKSETATELTLKLSYQIQGARWTPIYDADLDTKTGKIELKTLAQISQRTGEDWKNVDVTLSTLRPSAGTQLPQLNTWVLDFMQGMSPTTSSSMVNKRALQSKSKRMGSMMRQETDEVAFAEAAPMQEMKQAESPSINTEFSAEYKVPEIISLNSGSNKRRFALTSQNFDADVHLASAPRLDPRAMILATTKHTGENPLLAGNVSLYRNGSFVGNTHLQQKLSGEEIKLSFGEDDKVKIKFLPDPDKKRKDGLLFGKKKVVERHYKLTINNNHNKPYKISLYDVFPVSSNEEIVVKLLGDKPSKKDLEDKKGVVSWERTLNSKQDTKLKYGYTVSYPEDGIVPGL